MLLKTTMNLKDVTGTQTVWLTNEPDIERKFIEILNNHKDAYWDELSLQFMKEIDTAERQGDYGVKTNYKESCITCLSTGCKFGLLVLYYHSQMPDLKIIVEYAVARDNVWKWLAAHTNVTLYIFDKDLIGEFEEFTGLCIELKGVIYEVSKNSDIGNLTDYCESLPYTMTKKTESKAYEHYRKLAPDEICCKFKETVTLKEFILRFPDTEYLIENGKHTAILGHSIDAYSVINYCNYLPLESTLRRYPLYVCGETEGRIKRCKKKLSKYRTLWTLFLYDVIQGDYSVIEDTIRKSHRFGDVFERWFVLILNSNQNEAEEEKCLITDYPKETLYGIEVNPKNYCITIYDPKQAVEHFHELYQKSKPINNQYEFLLETDFII